MGWAAKFLKFYRLSLLKFNGYSTVYRGDGVIFKIRPASPIISDDFCDSRAFLNLNGPNFKI